MPNTPEIPVAADVSREKLALAAETHRELAALSEGVSLPADVEAPQMMAPNLQETTKILVAQGRSPQEIAALTLSRGYPQAS